MKQNLRISPSEDFDQSDFATDLEQDQAITNAIRGGGTGINPHGYNGSGGQEILKENGSPLSLGYPLYESNGADRFYNGRNPVFTYPPDAYCDLLPLYNKTKHGNYLLEPYRDYLWAANYFFYCIALPFNQSNGLITWRQTYRDQIDVPANSFLVAIQAKGLAFEGELFQVPTTFRLQIYDDGAGEYIYNAPVGTQISAGNDTPSAANGNGFGPFILPSPLSICPNGMITVTMTNTETTGTPNSATVGAIRAYLGLIFAVPRNTPLGLG